MERGTLVSLEDLITSRAEPFNDNDLIALCHSAVSALQSLSIHFSHIVSSFTISPASLLFSENGEASFNLQIEETDQAFLAPEVSQTESGIFADVTIDSELAHVYSLGACLHSCCAAELTGAAARRLFRRMRDPQPVRRPSVSQLLAECRSLLPDSPRRLAGIIVRRHLRQTAEVEPDFSELDIDAIRQSQAPELPAQQQATLNELDNWAFGSGKGGVVRCSTECLALLREFCMAALQFDPASSQLWVHGLSLDNFVLDSTGRCRLQDSSSGGRGFSGQLSPLRWLPPEYSSSGLATDYEKTVAYAIGVALLNVLDVFDDDDDGEGYDDNGNGLEARRRQETEFGPRSLDPVLYSILESLCHDRSDRRPALATVRDWCSELEGQCPGGGYRRVLAAMFARLHSQRQSKQRQQQQQQQPPPLPARTAKESARLRLMQQQQQPQKQQQQQQHPPPPPQRRIIQQPQSQQAKSWLPPAFTSRLTHFTPIDARADDENSDAWTATTSTATAVAAAAAAEAASKQQLAERLRLLARENRRRVLDGRLCLESMEADSTPIDWGQHQNVMAASYQLLTPLAADETAETDLNISSVGFDDDPGGGRFLPTATAESTASTRQLARYKNRQSVPPSSYISHKAYSDPVVAEHWLTRTPPRPIARNIRDVDLVEQPPSHGAAVAAAAHRDSPNADSGVSISANHQIQQLQQQQRFSTAAAGQYATPMERLLSNDAVHYQHTLASVIRLLHREFSLDGCPGVDLPLLAEYIVSLVNLSWATFTSAVTERFPDLYWSDDLLRACFGIVNTGREPPPPLQSQPQPPPTLTTNQLPIPQPLATITIQQQQQQQPPKPATPAPPVPVQTKPKLSPSPPPPPARSSITESSDHTDLQWRLQQLRQQLVLTAKDVAKVKKLSRQQPGGSRSCRRDLAALTARMEYLEASCRQAEALYADNQGLPLSLCQSLAGCLRSGSQLQLVSNADYSEAKVAFRRGLVHSADPDCLAALLFCRQSISTGFVWEYFFGYRYFETPEDLVKIITTAMRNTFPTCLEDGSHQSLVLDRGLNILLFWLFGFYQIDFRERSEALATLKAFMEFLSDQAPKLADKYPSITGIFSLYSDCQRGIHVDLQYCDVDVSNTAQYTRTQTIIPRPVSFLPWPQLRVFSPDRVTERLARQLLAERLSEPATDRPLAVVDCAEIELAASLCALSRQKFLACHPVDLLTGSSAGLTEFLAHCDRLSRWCTAELLAAGPGAKQRALLARRLWLAASECADRGDLASAVALAEGLSGPRLQWAPGLHRLDARASRARKRLTVLRARLLSEPMTQQTAVPHPRLLRAHLQSLEVGSFRLASGHVKWDKVRRLALCLQPLRMARQVIVGGGSGGTVGDASDIGDDRRLTRQLSRRIEELAGADLDLLLQMQADSTAPTVAAGLATMSATSGHEAARSDEASAAAMAVGRHKR